MVTLSALRRQFAEVRSTLGATLIDSSKQPIMWLVMMMVAMFIAGMWILSSLNLEYSQRAMGELRQKQIEDTFLANHERISARQFTLEIYTIDLARLGTLVYAFNPEGRDRKVEAMLRHKLTDFREASGVGIWLEAGALPGRSVPLSVHVYRDDQDRLQSALADSSDFRQQPWHELGLPGSWKDKDYGGAKLYWTPAYYNTLTDTAVITLVSPVFAPDGSPVGYATTDWEAGKIIDLVSQADITPNTFAFLIDRSNRKLSSLSRLENELQAQHLIDAVIEQQLAGMLEAEPATLSQQRVLMQTSTLESDGRAYALYFAGTPAGMLFGVGVPRLEIDAVMAPMRSSNERILLGTGLVMLLLSGYLFYRIARLMRELQASYTDALTGLPNRARLLQDLERGRGGMLVLINLDRFKEINSLFGHACGDAVLQAMAQRIETHAADSALLRFARLYRLNADEFVLLGSALSGEELEEFVELLSDFMQSLHVSWQDQDISLAATLGVAVCDSKRSGQPCSADQLISQATVALRQAREQSRDYQFYAAVQGVERDYAQNLVWARRLKDALNKDQIVPWFQPIIDNASGRVSKYECLVRMVDADGAVISPAQFLGVAGKLRLDPLLTRIMIDKSFKTFVNLPYEFSINLSYRDLLDAELTDFIIERLRLTGLGPRLIFEILESAGIENYNEVRRFINRVKEFGCRIAIDDFGSGYSNFEHLLRLNVDLIKIDGSLIKNLHEDDTALAVTRGVVQFARSLGIDTVAEFVHCGEVQQQVLALGIQYSQGGYFSMPQPSLVEDVAGG